MVRSRYSFIIRWSECCSLCCGVFYLRLPVPSVKKGLTTRSDPKSQLSRDNGAVQSCLLARFPLGSKVYVNFESSSGLLAASEVRNGDTFQFDSERGTRTEAFTSASNTPSDTT